MGHVNEVYTGLGFALGSVRGARAFRVDEHGMLRGIFYRQAWTPGENTAVCRRRQHYVMPMFGGAQTGIDYDAKMPDIESGHMAGCQCGFYGFYEGSNDYNRQGNASVEYVSGVIEGWGETVLGTRGFRCQKARLIALQITPGVPGFEAVVPRYSRIPMFTTFADMVREFPPSNGGDVIQSLPAAGEE